MKRIAKTLTAATLAAATVLSVGACGQKNVGGKDKLQIFVSNFGYGTDWADALIEEFQKEQWVKDKYEAAGRTIEIAIPDSDRERSLPITYIEGGYTNYDLIFSCELAGDLDIKQGDKVIYEDLTELWNTTIPGETQTVKEKMKPAFVASADRDVSADGEVYKEFPWVGGSYGFVYNKHLVDEYLGEDYQMPRTTYELLEMGKAFNEAQGAPKLFLVNKEGSYFYSAFYMFWGQYAGEEKVWQYCNGQNEDGEYDVNVLKDTGRLRATEAIEEMIVRTGKNSGEYANLSSYYKAYGVAQGDFLRGKGVIMSMGDWFELEMREFQNDPNNAQYIDPETDIRWMSNPVLSATVETLELYTAGKEYSALTDREKEDWDAKLTAIIDAIDNGETSLEGVSASDFAKVKSARECKVTLGGHVAYIPGYSDAKELAKDFLLFMASDKGIETFIKSTKGVSTAFNYTIDKTSDLWDEVSVFHKDRLLEEEKGSWYMGRGYVTPLTFTGLFGENIGFGVMKNKTLESAFCSEDASDRMSAAAVCSAVYDYFSANNNKVWQNLLTEAGVSN